MKYEYHIRYWNKPDLGEVGPVLNQLGNEGWELVSVTTTDHHQTTYYFKREKKNVLPEGSRMNDMQDPNEDN